MRYIQVGCQGAGSPLFPSTQPTLGSPGHINHADSDEDDCGCDDDKVTIVLTMREIDTTMKNSYHPWCSR